MARAHISRIRLTVLCRVVPRNRLYRERKRRCVVCDAGILLPAMYHPPTRAVPHVSTDAVVTPSRQGVSSPATRRRRPAVFSCRNPALRPASCQGPPHRIKCINVTRPSSLYRVTRTVATCITISSYVSSFVFPCTAPSPCTPSHHVSIRSVTDPCTCTVLICLSLESAPATCLCTSFE